MELMADESRVKNTSPRAFTGLTDGNHTFRIKAIDTNGKESAVSSYDWNIAVPVPTVSISANPTAIAASASANFSFSGTAFDGATIASYQCSVDSTTLAACVSPKSFTGLADGNHTFRIKAIDSAGRESLVSTYSWTTDTTAPVVTIGSYPSSLNNLSTVDFGFSATDTGGSGVASYQLHGRWNGSNFVLRCCRYGI